MTIADTITGLEVPKLNTKGMFKLKKSSPPKEKHIHIVIKKEDIKRLEKLQAAVYPHTQTEVFTNALQLLEEMLDQHDQGSVFYVKRPNQEVEIFDVFGE